MYLKEHYKKKQQPVCSCVLFFLEVFVMCLQEHGVFHTLGI